MISQREEHVAKIEQIISDFMEYSKRVATFDEVSELMRTMGELDVDFLPYSAITALVYNKYIDSMTMKKKSGHVDLDSFLNYYNDNLQQFENDKECVKCNQGQMCNGCSQSYRVALKIYEHLELAQQQLDSLFSTHEQKISEIEDAILEVENLKKDNEEFVEKLERLELEIQKSTSSYISILGIFAAILLGAFGAMQGFTSLFENASSMKLSKLLIVSGVGGLTVVTILHMLLDAIAKLSNRSIRSTTETDAPFYKNYPFLSVALYSLWAVIISGVSLKYAQEFPKIFNVDLMLVGFLFLVGISLPLIIIYFSKLIKEFNQRKVN